MKKLFYLLLMLLITYGCFVGYRMYKNRVDGIFVEKILKVAKNHYSKLEKVSKEKYDIEDKISSLKSTIEKNKKEMSKTNDKPKNQKSIKEEKINKSKAYNAVEDNNEDLEAAPAIDVYKMKEENKKLEKEMERYEKFVIELKKVEETLEKKSSEFYDSLKKCQLNFISPKVHKKVSKFLSDYEEQESELNKTIENVLNNASLLKSKYNPQIEEKKKKE